MTTGIRLTESGGVAQIMLDRPEAANTLNAGMARELATVAAHCDRSASIKAVVLTGTGRFFCAGGDLKSMVAASEDTGAYVKSTADDLHRAISTFARMAPPLIVAVNGVAAGAGFSLALVGDLVLAASSASFTMAYTKAGLSPDGSSSFYLPRIVGMRRTAELMLTNRTLSATEAMDWGMVNRVMPDETLMGGVRDLASALAAGAWRSQAIVKQLLLVSGRNGLEEQMEFEGRAIAECASSADGREGLTAFRDKRPPSFAETRRP